jgi:hypothetical protein
VNGQATDQQAANRTGSGSVLLLACVLIVLAGFVCVAFSGPALSGHATSRAISGETIILLFGIIAIVVLLRVTHHAEHRLRSHTQIARSYVGAMPAGAPSAAAFGPGQLGSISRASVTVFGRTYSPSTLCAGALVSGAIATVFVALAIVNYSKAERSSFVQAHGTSTLATVVSVNNEQYCGRSSCYWNATIPVELARPTDGASATVVSYPQYSSLISGQRITVLVDPRQPGYAELPGVPFKTTVSWVLELAVALVFLASAAFHSRGLLSIRNHRSDHIELATPAAGPLSEPA